MIIKNRKGLTLVEIILAMAILGIVAVAIFPVFTSGLIQIARTGDVSDSVFQTAGQIELLLTQRDQDDRTTDLMDIELDGSTYTPKGHIEEISITIRDSDVQIAFFFPGY